MTSFSKSINILIVVTLLATLSACAKRPVTEHVYMYPEPVITPPQVPSEAIQQAQREESERIAREQEEKRRKEEDKQKRMILEERRIQETIVSTQDRIADFRHSISIGACNFAAKQAQVLGRSVQSIDNELEADLTSSVCLCYLEIDGDIERFKTCSEDLGKLVANQNYLTKQSQFILALKSYLTSKKSMTRDNRVDMQLNNGLESIFSTSSN